MIDATLSRRFAAALSAVSCAALAACTSLAPTYERPAAPVAATFPDSDPAVERGQPAADVDWQTFFADERVRHLVTLALQNNRDLRVAVLNIEQTRAQLQVRRADEWPTVNAGVAGSRQPNASGGITSQYTAGPFSPYAQVSEEFRQGT